jgi:hypothetical protein
MKQTKKTCSGGAVHDVALLSSRAVGETGAVVLGHGKPIFRATEATPKHVLHASTQIEHRSPTQNSAIKCLWCVQ